MFEVWYKMFEETEWKLYETYNSQHVAEIFYNRLVYDGYEAKIVRK